MDEGTVEGLIAAAFAIGVPVAYLCLQVRVLSSWSGWWHVAGTLPLLGLVPLLSYSLGAYQENSDDWRLLLVMAAPAGFLYLAVLDAVYWVAEAPSETRVRAVTLRAPTRRRLRRRAQSFSA